MSGSEGPGSLSPPPSPKNPVAIIHDEDEQKTPESPRTTEEPQVTAGQQFDSQEGFLVQAAGRWAQKPEVSPSAPPAEDGADELFIVTAQPAETKQDESTPKLNQGPKDKGVEALIGKFDFGIDEDESPPEMSEWYYTWWGYIVLGLIALLSIWWCGVMFSGWNWGWFIPSGGWVADSHDSFRMERLLGKEVITQTGDVYATSKLNGYDTIAIYLGLGACPKWITDIHSQLKGKNFRLVYMSVDSLKDHGSYPEDTLGSAFTQYTMFGSRRITSVFDLIRNHNGGMVWDLPKLIFLNPRTGGWRAFAKSDKLDIKNYPFRNEVFPELETRELLTQDDKKKSSIKTLRSEGCKYLVLYFDAFSQEGSQRTNQLSTWYETAHKEAQGSDNQFEVLFVSFDRSEDNFQRFYEKHGSWLALEKDDDNDDDLHIELMNRFQVGNSRFSVVDIETGCLVSTLDLGTKPFEPDYIVPDYSNTLWNEFDSLFLTFAPLSSDAKDARKGITPVAARYKHALDQPIGFAIVSGYGWAVQLRKDFGLPNNFRGSVIASREKRGRKQVWVVYKDSSLASGTPSTSTVDSFVGKFLDTWSGEGYGRKSLEVVKLE